MHIDQPITFEPLFMERVWGGRRLETLYGKHLPMCDRIGESWEMVDREEAQSVVHAGVLRGATLHDLWIRERESVFGKGLPESERFPLLFKILDAQDRLSVQVHPPASMAAELGGEPKTEMWYLLDTMGNADLFAGLNRSVSREDFERELAEGRVAELIHRIPVRAGDAILIPSGRIHAIGTGNMVFEVQQNSDTTYRVFDWDRLGLDGKPRALHIPESLVSIDFDDVAPKTKRLGEGNAGIASQWFQVEKWNLTTPRISREKWFSVCFVLSGSVKCAGAQFTMGQLFLVPPGLSEAALEPVGEGVTILRTTIPA